MRLLHRRRAQQRAKSTSLSGGRSALRYRVPQVEVLESRWMLSTISFVKNIGTNTNFTQNSRSLAITVPAGGVHKGHSVIVELSMDPKAGTVSATDTAGNIYTVDKDTRFQSSGSANQGVRTVVLSSHGVKPLAAGNSITVSFPTAKAKAVSAAEFCGIAAGTQSITATDTATPSITGTQGGIQVVAAATSKFQVTAPPSTVAGAPFSFTVTAQDAFGNTTPGYMGTAQFTSSDGMATLPGNYSFTAGDAGSHTFVSGATLRTAGNRSITATDTVTASITGSANVNVQAAAAQSLVVAGFPSPTVAGAMHNFMVTAFDPFGNLANYLGTVQFTSSDPQAMLPGNYTFTAGDGGTRTFTGALKTAGLQSITATDTGNPTLSGTQANINVLPAAPAVLDLTAPGSAFAGFAFDVSVRVTDAFGNLTSNYLGTVAFTSSDPAATLPGNYTFTAGDAGFHTFVGGVTLNTRGIQSITVTDVANNTLTDTAMLNVLAEHFDFNRQSPDGVSPTAPGHSSVLQDDVYTLARQFGWNVPVGGFDRDPLPYPQSDLLRDGHWGIVGAPRTFRVDVPNGTYFVTATVGDFWGRDNIEINAEGGAAELPDIDTGPGEYFHGSFLVDVLDGALEVTISDLGNDPYWVINALHIRRVPVFGVTFTTSLGTVPADPLQPPDTITGTAPPGTLLTLQTTIGTILTDHSALYQGTQVLVDGSGNFSFQLQRSAQAGAPLITAAAVDGFADGASTSIVTYTIPTVRRFDFDAAATSAAITQAGFIPVRGNSIYSTSHGYGWSAAVGEFDRGPVSGSSALKRDGHWGSTSAAGTFRVAAEAGKAYDVRVYVGDIYARDAIQVSVEGGPFVTVPATGAGQYTSLAILGVVAADSVLDITIRDAGGDPYWVVNGVDIALAAASGGSGLPPGQLPLIAATGVNGDGTVSATPLTEDALDQAAAAAVARWAAAGLSAGQLAALEAATVRIVDLDEQGYLGLAEFNGTQVQIDDNAVGYGWFIDSTPWEDSEFAHEISASELRAAGGSEAATSYDLLTVLMHEFGHILGLVDLDDAVAPHSVMTEALNLATRRVPTSGDLAATSSPLSIAADDDLSVLDPTWLFESSSASALLPPETREPLVTVSSRIVRSDWAPSAERRVAVFEEWDEVEEPHAFPEEVGALDAVFEELGGLD